MVGQSTSRREAPRLDEIQVAHKENPREGQARSRREARRLEERPLAPPDGLYEVQRLRGYIASDREIYALGPYSAGKKRSNRRRKKNRRSKRRDHSDTSDSESASPETTESEEDEAVVRSLRPLPTTNELFLKVLDYRNYRRANRSEKYSGSVARRVAKWAKQMQLTITDKFSGSDPIAFLRFLTLFSTACDQNGVNKSAALSDPQVVHYLLETYAMDDVIRDAHQEVISFRQSSNMTESAFADDLWKRAYRCENGFSKERLERHFITGLLPAIWTNLRNYHTENPQYSFRRLVTYAEGNGKTYRTSRRKTDKTRGHATPLRKPNQGTHSRRFGRCSNGQCPRHCRSYGRPRGRTLCSGRNGNPIRKLLEGRLEANPPSLSPCLNQLDGHKPKSSPPPNENHPQWTTQDEPQLEHSNDPICILRKENYKVRVTVRLRSNNSEESTAVLNTGTGPNLVHPKLLPLGWQDFVQATNTPRITD
ncbi:unnamed protein product [Agarophyton chilense]